MTPVEVAKYLRCFQKAAATRKVKSRMLRRDSRFQDNLAELIRAILPKAYFKLTRRRRGYELVWQGTYAVAERLAPRLGEFGQFGIVTTRAANQHYGTATEWVEMPTEALLDLAVRLQPVIARFKRDEARGVEVPVAAGLAPEPIVAEVDEANEFLEVDEEEVNLAPPIPVTPVTPPVNPQTMTDAFAAAARAREQTDTGGVTFRSEGARRFAEMLARANRGRQ